MRGAWRIFFGRDGDGRERRAVGLGALHQGDLPQWRACGQERLHRVAKQRKIQRHLLRFAPALRARLLGIGGKKHMRHALKPAQHFMGAGRVAQVQRQMRHALKPRRRPA